MFKSFKRLCFGVLLALGAAAVSACSASHTAGIPLIAGGTTQGQVRRSCNGPVTQIRCFALFRTNGAPGTGSRTTQATTPSGYAPLELQEAYNLTSAAGTNGTGQTVAIVDAYDDPNAESDLAVYRAQYGLGECTTADGCFKKVNQSGVQGSYPPADAGWAEEISLDVDMVSAICPKCHILLVEAADSYTGLEAAEDTAAANASVVSNSYGGPEPASATDSHYNHPGTILVAGTGDNCYENSCPDQYVAAMNPCPAVAGGPTCGGPLPTPSPVGPAPAPLAANWPSSLATVVAVGGTTLTRADNTRQWAETVWTGGGSACSSYVPKPTWQTDFGCPNRMAADIAAVADPNTGVAVYDTYGGDVGWVPAGAGGTSVATPIIAATYALAGQATSNVYARSMYSHASELNDVTSGANGSCNSSYVCTGGAGYDGPTGVGTPNGIAAFLADSAPVGARDISVGSDGTIWALANDCTVPAGDCGIYTSTNGGASFSLIGGRATHITGAAGGKAWVVNSAGAIYLYDSASASFTAMPGSASRIAVGSGGVVWALSNTCSTLSNGCAIFRSTDNGSSYTQVSGTAVDIATDAAGDAIAISSQGGIYKYDSTNNSFDEEVSGSASTDALSSAGALWVLGTCSAIVTGGCNIYKSSDLGSTYAQVAGTAYRISIDPSGAPWVLNEFGSIYKGTDATGSSYTSVAFP